MASSSSLCNEPLGFQSFTRAKREAWARQQIEAIALEMLHDMAADMGVDPTKAQVAAYLANMRPRSAKSVQGDS